MNTWEKIVMVLLAVCVAVMFAILIVFGVAAEDNNWGGCTDKNAVNYSIAIPDMEAAGFRVVDDGSCYYLKCQNGACENGTKEDNNYFEWLDEVYGPAYYGQLIDVGGCTDPEAVNWMDPQWWPDYNIIDDGSCVYAEEFEF